MNNLLEEVFGSEEAKSTRLQLCFFNWLVEKDKVRREKNMRRGKEGDRNCSAMGEPDPRSYEWKALISGECT